MTATVAAPGAHRSSLLGSSLRTPAVIGGVSLLVLAVLSGWANFGVLETLVTEGDAARTARDVLASETTFRLGVLAWLVVVVLDVVVAWALWKVFAPVHRTVSAVAAISRSVYAGLLLWATTYLAGAISVLATDGRSAGIEQVQAEAMRRIEYFHLLWDVGLLLFGVHLILVGWLAYRASYVPRWLGVLLVIAGAGYAVDSVGVLVTPGSLPAVAVFTFFGEVLLIWWLLARGRDVHVTTRTEQP